MPIFSNHRIKTAQYIYSSYAVSTFKIFLVKFSTSSFRDIRFFNNENLVGKNSGLQIFKTSEYVNFKIKFLIVNKDIFLVIY
jgi:hypothetical protein